MSKMDPELQRHSVEFGEVMLRNTAGVIADRIRAVKAKKKDQETVAELEDIISNLLSDKSALARITQTFEEELVAQRIAASDIEYISNNLVPLLEELLGSAAHASGQGTPSVQEVIDLLQPILSVETVTVLQLIGFNFRQAIGQPLTQLLARLILSKAQTDSSVAQEIQRLVVERDLALVQLASDPEAYARFKVFSQGR